jgi:hypothetical protein
LKTLAYVLEEEELNISDEEETIIKVERNVYNLLKYYIRLVKNLNPRRVNMVDLIVFFLVNILGTTLLSLFSIHRSVAREDISYCCWSHQIV